MSRSGYKAHVYSTKCQRCRERRRQTKQQQKQKVS